MWEAISNFLSCSTKKRLVYDHGQQPTRDTPRTRDELEPMIRDKPREEIRPVQPSGPSRACVICSACCGCLCAALVAVLGVLGFLMGTVNVEVEDTNFTFWNYYIPQLKYLLAGQADTESWTQWYEGLASEEEPLVGHGPGPNTRIYYGWHDVKERLEEFVVRIRDGTLRRHNELGMTILSDAMWPQTGTVVTGLTNSDHGAVRPYLGAALDGAEGAWDKNCDGSACWNEAWLRRTFKNRFAHLQSFSRDDLVWIVGAVLHKVHLNLDLPDEMMKDFAVLQQQLIKVAPFSNNWFWEMVLGSQKVLMAKQDYEERYKEAIKQKWPEDQWDRSPVKLTVLASAMLDSLTLIGGAAVSTSLDFLLSLMFMEGEPGRSIRPLDLDNDAQLNNFVWETLRRFPPVQAVPRWVTNDPDDSWRHEILSVYQAMHDPNIFPEPLEYRLGRPGLNHQDSSLSLGWADFAMVDGKVSDPDSHSCPAKQLSFRLIGAFLREFDAAGPWEVSNPSITLSSYGSSGWTLHKRGAPPSP